MANFVFQNKKIYFEEYGQGAPLVMLNGIMMSCGSWAEFVAPLSAQNRLILVDMLDQGKSDKMDGPFSQAIQVDVVVALMDFLGLEKASILGISYGGEVAQRFAIAHPQRVDRLMLFNTTAATGPWLSAVGESWNKAAYDGDAYYYTTIPIIYSPAFYKKNYAWMEQRHQVLRKVFSNPSFMASMERLTNSSNDFDVLDQLHTITAPTLVVASGDDHIIPPEEQARIAAAIPESHYVVIPGCGHASMYEKPVLFTALALGFLNTNKVKFDIT